MLRHHQRYRGVVIVLVAYMMALAGEWAVADTPHQQKRLESQAGISGLL